MLASPADAVSARFAAKPEASIPVAVALEGYCEHESNAGRTEGP